VAETKLVVETAEAKRVREIFEMYLEHRSLLAVVKELNARDWRTKCWTTRKGTVRGGRPFDKNALYDLLTNVAYVGKVRYKDEVHQGEHKPILDADLFSRVQSLLQRNYRSGGRTVGSKYSALLRGRLHCAACDCGMTHTYTAKGNRHYRYYVCHRAQKQGWQVCPSPSIPAAEIERFVIDEIRGIGRDPLVIEETLIQARWQADGEIERLAAERADLVARLRDDHAEAGHLAATARPGDSRLLDAHERIRDAERRVTEIDDELATLEGKLIDKAEVAAALADFDALWDSLAPREQARVVELLVERVAYDGHAGNIAITFRPAGIKTLAGELASRKEEAA
jgi:site-specific DNA recombinase